MPVAAPNSVPHGNAALGMAEDQPVDFPGSRMFLAEAEEPPGKLDLVVGHVVTVN